MIDLLVAEIGSTTTVVNAFADLSSCPTFVGQGQGATSVLDGDVRIGLSKAIEDLESRLGERIEYCNLIATSSAAGGLRMTVHGLVHEMTVKAAKEAALGAGANIKMITSGKMRRTDIKRLLEIRPNIILIAGGVDYGERDTALHNAEMIAELNLNIPVIYAGNIENQEEMREIFEGKNSELYLVENVYPEIDRLNVESTRRVIQDVFEKHIVHAPGMEHVREMVSGSIMPTPGAVMQASKFLSEKIGNLITIDVGGATTDVHSVTDESDEIARIMIHPEPKAKRTVEGDMGMYVSLKNVLESADMRQLSTAMGESEEELRLFAESVPPIPTTEKEIRFVEELTKVAVLTAMDRHAGHLRTVYGAKGKTLFAEGKDLTMVKYIIGTGGALTRLPRGKEILKSIAFSNPTGEALFPTESAQVLIDEDYIMASLGVMSIDYPEAAFRLLLNSVGIKEEFHGIS